MEDYSALIARLILRTKDGSITWHKEADSDQSYYVELGAIRLTLRDYFGPEKPRKIMVKLERVLHDEFIDEWDSSFTKVFKEVQDLHAAAKWQVNNIGLVIEELLAELDESSPGVETLSVQEMGAEDLTNRFRQRLGDLVLTVAHYQEVKTKFDWDRNVRTGRIPSRGIEFSPRHGVTYRDLNAAGEKLKSCLNSAREDLGWMKETENSQQILRSDRS